MTPRDFKKALADLAITPAIFAAETGVTARTAYRWTAGDKRIAPWVPAMLAYWAATGTAPGEVLSGGAPQGGLSQVMKTFTSQKAQDSRVGESGVGVGESGSKRL